MVFYTYLVENLNKKPGKICLGVDLRSETQL